ncbi:MAG: ferritin [Bacteroidota bacterium]|nr:ferritin [Bacteroidota bacterium]
MLTKNVQEALNNQLNLEFSSSYLYLKMAIYFEEINLVGFAKWMRVQAAEEYAHAMKIFEYIIQVNGKIKLKSIDITNETYTSPLLVFEKTLEHELKVTISIHKLVELAIDEKDYATNNFLQWFIQEQVEEESHTTYLVERLKMIGDNKSGLLYLDKEMAKRA